MAQIYKDELNDASIENALSLLENDARDVDSLLSAISSFVDGTKDKLQGPSYDAMRTKLQSYTSFLLKRKQITASLVDAINSGVIAMSNYMDEYSKLDEAEIPNVEQQISSLKQVIASYSGATSAEDKAQLSLKIEELAKLEKYLEKLEKLPAADQSAYLPLESIESQIDSYSSALSDVTVSTVTL